MISKDKQYKTRNGLDVRIYATDGYGKKPVHGAYLDKNCTGWIDYAWAITGASYLYGDGEPLDLIEVRPRHKRTVWLNVCEHVVMGCYENKWEADSCAGKDRLACIKVDLDFEEGDGL